MPAHYLPRASLRNWPDCREERFGFGTATGVHRNRVTSVDADPRVRLELTPVNTLAGYFHHPSDSLRHFQRPSHPHTFVLGTSRCDDNSVKPGAMEVHTLGPKSRIMLSHPA